MSSPISKKIPEPSGDLIHPHTRVFALEIQQTEQVSRGKESRMSELLTPSGACFSQFYTCGTITGVSRDPKAGWSIRVADPTGVLLLYVKARTPEIIASLDDLKPPAFVSVTGYVEPDNSAGSQGFRLNLETIHPSDRTARDQWILRTAMITLDRLDRLSSQMNGKGSNDELQRVISRYGSSPRQMKVLAGIVERALQQVQEIKPETSNENTEEAENPELQDTILRLVKQHSGPRGVSVQELTGFAKQEKISKSQLLDAIRALIAEDELYQPSSGFVKIL